MYDTYDDRHIPVRVVASGCKTVAKTVPTLAELQVTAGRIRAPQRHVRSALTGSLRLPFGF